LTIPLPLLLTQLACPPTVPSMSQSRTAPFPGAFFPPALSRLSHTTGPLRPPPPPPQPPPRAPTLSRCLGPCSPRSVPRRRTPGVPQDWPCAYGAPTSCAMRAPVPNQRGGYTLRTTATPFSPPPPPPPPPPPRMSLPRSQRRRRRRHLRARRPAGRNGYAAPGRNSQKSAP